MLNPLWTHRQNGPVEKADRTLLSADNKATVLAATRQLATTHTAARTTRADPPPRTDRTLLLTRIPMATRMPSPVRDRHQPVPQVSGTWASSRLRAHTPRTDPPATRRDLPAQEDRALVARVLVGPVLVDQAAPVGPMRTEVRDPTRAERRLGERNEGQGGERPLPSL